MADMDNGIPRAPACPVCKRDLPLMESSKVSSEGWVIFFALLLFCFALCFIGLLVRDKTWCCSKCGIEIGQ